MKSLILSLATILTIGGFSLILAQNGENKSSATTKTDVVTQVENIQLAYLNAKYGRRTKNADAMIVAARILKSIIADKLEIPTEQVDAENEFSYQSILADARKFAEKNRDLLNQIKAVEKMTPPVRGAIGTPKRVLAKVNSSATNSVPISFRGGEPAIIILSGNGKSDLDLYVYDENGTLVASDKDRLDDCTVRFYPKTSGRFTVKIKNNGGILNNYVLTTN